MVRLIASSAIPFIWIAIHNMELEVFGKRERKNAIIVADFIWPVSNLILTLVVYYVRHWTFMHLWLGGISLLALPCLYFIPESPRWLAINNKVCMVFV